MSNDHKKDNDENNPIIMTFVISENLPVPIGTLTIPELTLEESLEMKLIGTAAGIDPGACAYIALQYDPNFVSRVKGYRIIEDDHQDFKILKMFHPEAVAVNFYE